MAFGVITSSAFPSPNIGKISGGKIHCVTMADLGNAIDNAISSALSVTAYACTTKQKTIGNGIVRKGHRWSILWIVHSMAVGAGAGDSREGVTRYGKQHKRRKNESQSHFLSQGKTPFAESLFFMTSFLT